MDSSLAIDALRHAIPDGQFSLRGTAEYENLNSSYLSQLESDLKPACILQPRSKQDVAAFVRAIQPFASKGDTKFAVRGGGQQPAPSCANIQNSITVDLGLIIAASEIYKIALEPIKLVEGLRCSFTLQPYPVSLLEKSAQNGGNSLGLNAANGPLVSVLLLSYWQDAEDDKRVLEMIVALEKIKAEASDKGPYWILRRTQ
ncbi:uncharacterized protein F4817DRAFT_314867 [Daldinia loculata]|uniref:uncharacterized protein n=1 Tax=Daldinia loculata TaxID=103429 RepID=UPI0020C4F3E9|nr:uncharacterized protein F4817DRAFT_314867 [Daldinia loculata]KAI1648242.1 hypothetical protein F4817DRAFT_314867 [Daldinia loculata]